MGTLAQAYEQSKTKTGTELPQGTLSRAFAGSLAGKAATGSSISGPGTRAGASGGSGDVQLPPGAIAGAVQGAASGVSQGANALADTKIADKTGTSGMLSQAGNVASGIGGAAGVVGGVQQGGVKGYGSAVAGGAQVADAVGLGGTTSNVAGAVGNAASGNYIGAAKDVAKIVGGAGGTSLAGVGAASNAALADAGFGAAWATPSVEASVAGASGAGAGAAGGAAAAGGTGAGAAISAVGYAAGVAAAFIGAAKLAVHAFAGGRSQDRNLAAFTGALGDKLEKTALLSGKAWVPYYNVPGKGWISAKDFQEIAGAWYGATYAPDGDQAGWQKKLEDKWAATKTVTADDLAKVNQTSGNKRQNEAAIAKLLGG